MAGWRLELDADLLAPRVLRRTLDGWLLALGCDDDERHDAVLAFSEFVSIAVTDTVEPIVVTVLHSDTEVHVGAHYQSTLEESTGSRPNDTRWRLLETIGLQMAFAAEGSVRCSWTALSR